MARTVAQSHHRITYDARRPHLQPSAVTIRNTGGIRVLDKQASSSASSRQVSNSTEKAVIKAVAPLYKRILYPDSEPPRNLATAGAEVLDAQLYDLLALIVRGFILPWYTRISKERAFPLEVVRIVGCVLGRLETKLVGGEDDTAVDLVGIIAVSLPSILERHIRDYREAKLMEDSAYGAGAGPSATASLKITQFQAAFHSLQPHAGIYPSGRHGSGESESQPEKLPSYIKGDYLRAVVDALLKEVLPEEDYAAETERTVVREVIIGIILAGVLNKVSQPWFIHQLVIKLLPSPSKADSVARVGFTEPERATRLSFWQRVLAAPRTISVFLTSSGSYRRRTSVRNLSTPSISLAFRALRSQEPGRQILGQLECLTLALTTLFSSWLDRLVPEAWVFCAKADVHAARSE